MYSLLKPLLFRLNPEAAHCLSLVSLRYGLPLFWTKKMRDSVPSAPCSQWGLHFPNPVGLAAGLDKDGECIDAWLALGFGFVEVGTVTPKPQPGNPRPRLFRLEAEQALINRMGFNNQGVDHLVTRLKQRKLEGIVGVNIGKNKETPLAQAVEDYRYCLEKVYPLADYITLNISSPNTPGLRELQQEQYLEDLLKALKTRQAQLAKQHQRSVPLLVKISPDLNPEELYVLADLLLRYEIEGVIATNTTLDRTGVRSSKYSTEQGGLSGKPLALKSTVMIKLLHEYCGSRLPIVGVGGILSAQDAQEKSKAGASLVQVYAGLIYRGPELIREIVSNWG